MPIEFWRPSAETAQKVLAFFAQNPNRADCIVGFSDAKGQVIYKRDNITHLQRIVDKEYSKPSTMIYLHVR